MKKLNLNVPNFFDPANAGDRNYESPFVSDFGLLSQEASKFVKQHGIKPSGSQLKNITLLGIDLQDSFCFPEGTLFVGGRSGTGAIDDNIRLSEFIYRNLDVIKNIKLTLDTHFLFQIFFTSFWLDASGNHPAAHTIISTEQIRKGEFKPNPKVASWLVNGNYPWLCKQVAFYADELEKSGKYQLYLWPPHTLLGTKGHNLVGVIKEAALFHGMARGVQPWFEIKGGNPLTENYSVLAPEVLKTFDGNALDQRNTEFIETLLKSDYLIIAGQAASHCVKSSIDDLLDEITTQRPELMKKVYILEDCMSSVTVPDGNGGFIMDFTPQTQEALTRYADAGMNLVKSTDPIETWPGLDLF